MTNNTRSVWARIGAIAGIGAILGAALVGATTSASIAGAGETGCPVGFETLSVPALRALGYSESFLTLVDQNLDDTICGKPLSDRQQEKFCESRACTVPVIYSARDNDVANQ